MAYTWDTHKEKLAQQWASMQIIRKRPEIEKTAKMLLEHFSIYEEVSRQTNGVPPDMIAAIDLREGGGHANRHLHNGCPLSGYTRLVPAGRPHLGHPPPFKYVESAVDALKMKGLHLIGPAGWSIERRLHEMEPYNGLGWMDPDRKIDFVEMEVGEDGLAWRKMISSWSAKEGLEYYNRGLPSPYIWSCTNIQRPGKYVSDGNFDPNVMDQQIGVAPLIKVMSLLAPDRVKVWSYKDGPPPVVKPVPVPVPPVAHYGLAAALAAALGYIMNNMGAHMVAIGLAVAALLLMAYLLKRK